MTTSEDFALLDALMGFSPELICALTPEGNFRRVSGAFQRALGYESAELEGRHFSKILHPDGAAAALGALLDTPGRPVPGGIECRCLTKAGQEVGIAWAPLASAPSERLLFRGRELRPSSEAAGQALALEQAALCRAIIEHGEDLVGLVDAAGVYLYTGGATYKVLGYRPEELLGRVAFDFVHPEDADLVRQCWDLLAHQPVVTIPSFRFRTATGEWRWLETTVSNHLHHSIVEAVVLNSRDITERKLSSLAQEESEQRFRLLFDNDAGPAAFQTPDGRVLDANPAMLSFLKKEKAEVLHQPLAALLPGEVSALFADKHAEAAGGRKVDFVTELQLPGQPAQTLKVTQTPLLVNGQVTGVHASVQDITEMAVAQRLITQQAEQFTTILESINDAFLSIDTNWNLVYLNGEAERLLGISKEGATGKSIWALCPEEAESIYRTGYQEAIDTQKTVRFEAYFERSRRWLELRAYPYATGLSIFFSDISKRIEDDKQLQLLAHVARDTDNGVVITDAAGRTEWVNDAFTKDTGYTLAELKGHAPDSVLQGPETDQDTVRYIRERLKRQKPFSATILYLKKSGKPVWLSEVITPIRNESGEVTHFVAIQQNITFRKMAEISQAKMTQDLYRHNRDLQQFTYVISHNLRSPLANALGLAKLLARLDKNSPAFGTALTNLQHSIEQVDDVLKDLNLVLSIRDKKDVLQPELLNLEEVCNQAVRDLNELLQECEGTVTLRFAPGLAASGNRAYLYSIFHNLLSNSIKYRSDERALEVRIEGTAGAHDGPTITFSDNGSGFDMFKAGSDVFQLYKRFHTNQRGRGIGLFLVKAHVEAMGGKIAVTSEVNFGTRFVINLNKR